MGSEELFLNVKVKEKRTKKGGHSYLFFSKLCHYGIACEIRNTGKPFSHNVVTGLVYDIVLSDQQVVRAYHCYFNNLHLKCTCMISKLIKWHNDTVCAIFTRPY